MDKGDFLWVAHEDDIVIFGSGSFGDSTIVRLDSDAWRGLLDFLSGIDDHAPCVQKEELVNISGLAGFCGKSVAQIYKLIKDGVLPCRDKKNPYYTRSEAEKIKKILSLGYSGIRKDALKNVIS